MPDPDKIIEAIQIVLEWIFGKDIPGWIVSVIGWALFFLLSLVFLWAVLLIISKLLVLWKETIEPSLYDAENRRRSLRRRHFANFIAFRIRYLNDQEDWRDYYFSELEAEVEAEGLRRIWPWLPIFSASKRGIRREPSLSRALEISQERLILLEGEPGSGKSVALRHIALRMAERASRSLNTKSLIPLYVNLKELDRSKKQPIDAALVRHHIWKVLNRNNDRDIESFLDDEFEHGLQDGTWFFLFDSFDEIPEILAATQANEVIRAYSDAIGEFLHGMNSCRGIIASRQFRGPDQTTWPRFRILPLSETRCMQQVHQAELKPVIEKQLLIGLRNAGPAWLTMASNPLFLGLLCEYMRRGNLFPENAHAVFEAYVANRLGHDEDRLFNRFRLKTQEVREVAEQVAYCMIADEGLGLSPMRNDILVAVKQKGFNPGANLQKVLDALVYLKLGRSEFSSKGEDSFTFAHRRFQEYFATCFVLREPQWVDTHTLLTNGRWRETAVTMCQSQPSSQLDALFREARRLLNEMISCISVTRTPPTPESIYVARFETLLDKSVALTGKLFGIPANPGTSIPEISPWQFREYINQMISLTREFPSLVSDLLALLHASAIGAQTPTHIKTRPFQWPSESLHLLGILQDGFSGRISDIPRDIRLSASRLILAGAQSGTPFDEKWALEVAGIVHQPVLVTLIQKAIQGDSNWIQEVAIRQMARLGKVPEAIALWLCRTIISKSREKKFGTERNEFYTYLSRLPQSTQYLRVLNITVWAPYLDLGLLMGSFAIPLFLVRYNTALLYWIWLISALVAYLGFWPNRWLPWDVSDETRLIAVLGRLLAGFLSGLSFTFIFFGPSVDQKLTAVDALIFIGVLYLVLWAPALLFAASTGLFTHPIWWPVAPLTPAFLVIIGTKTLLQLFRKLRPYQKLLAIGITCWLISMFIGFMMFIADASPPTVTESPPPSPEFFILPLILLALSLIVMGVILTVVLWYRVRLRVWLREHSGVNTITPEQFWTMLKTARLARYSREYVDLVRGQGLLQASEASELTLVHFILALQSIKRSKASIRFMESESSSRILARIAEIDLSSMNFTSPLAIHWIVQFERASLKDMKVIANSPRTRDALCILLEQIRDRRQKRI